MKKFIVDGVIHTTKTTGTTKRIVDGVIYKTTVGTPPVGTIIPQAMYQYRRRRI